MHSPSDSWLKPSAIVAYHAMRPTDPQSPLIEIVEAHGSKQDASVSDLSTITTQEKRS